jgi:signal transduction histidine kinase/DNA-binding response OmpR family regulator
MEPELKILILEDNPLDEELARREISKAGLSFTSRRTRSQDEFTRGLKEFCPDVVLLDYSVPGFGGLQGLGAVRELAPDTPCIIITGSLNEETAADCIKAGAADYVLKNNLGRLPPAIRGALENHRMARENRLAQEQLAKINSFFLSFGPDPTENINRLTALCGELMEADCAFYNRVDENLLSAVGQWHPPQDFNPIDKPDGRICRDVLKSDPGRLFLARALSRGPYAQGPEACHGFETYIGRSVKCGGTARGSLCALYRRDFEPRQTHDRVMGIVAAAIGVEEERLKAEKTREGLYEELRQSQKMEAVGRLAGGVAHDFNNALTAIKGHCELLLLDHPENSQEHDDLTQINIATDYAAALTRKLLAFSRKQVLAPRVLDLNTTVNEISTLLRRTIHQNIELSVRLSEGLSPVKADPGQLEQLLMNLALNARDAMLEGGCLTIETGHADTPDQGHCVTLRVSDTGTGMDAQTLERIYEPFFTTKELGKGTGLGLSTVYGIVKQSGGDIKVTSVPGKGTAFTISLPVVAGRLETAPAHIGTLDEAQGDETILLVDDEPTVRALCSRILRRCGYTVLEAADAEKALDIAAGHPEDIPLLVTDLVMPGLNGRQLAVRLLQQRPALKVLYISGYADETVVRHGLIEPGMELLQKPFNPMALGRKVRQMLDP